MKPKKHDALKLRFDRILSKSLSQQLLILAGILVLALGFSYLFLSWSGAEWEEYSARKDISPWMLPLYLLVDSNAFSSLYMGNVTDNNFEPAVHGWMLVTSAFTFLIGAFVFNGIIISIITTTIERRVQNYREGNLHYLKSGHHIIMGYDDMVPSIISHIFETDNDAYILILSSAEADDVREKLLKSFSAKQMEKILINYGHRVSIDLFGPIHVESASQIYVVGNHNKTAHDAINIECVDCLCRYLDKPGINNPPERITCFFKDIDTYAAFKTSDIFDKVGKLGIEFVPYNLYTGWAKQVFIKRRYKDFDNPGVEYAYPSASGKGLTPEDDTYVHLVFVGTTNFSVAFAMEAAHLLHFTNSRRHKTRITFIDRNMDDEKDEFITRNRHFFEVEPYLYRDLSKGKPETAPEVKSEYVTFKEGPTGFLDIQFEFIKGDVFSKNIQDLIQSWAEEHKKGKQILSMFLALADQRQNFLMGMNMPDNVYDNGVNLFIRQDRSDNFVTNLRNADRDNAMKKPDFATVSEDGQLHLSRHKGRYANIYPFGMHETAFCVDDVSLFRAKLINYLYTTADHKERRFMDMGQLEAIPKPILLEEADRMWSQLSVALKWSNLYSAYAIRMKKEALRILRGLSIGDTSRDFEPLTDTETDILAVVEHNRWNVEKLLMGYRKSRMQEDKYSHPQYAETLDKNRKHFVHHDIRPFEDLDNVSELDKEFSRYIPWLLKMTINSSGQ